MWKDYNYANSRAQTTTDIFGKFICSWHWTVDFIDNLFVFLTESPMGLSFCAWGFGGAGRGWKEKMQGV